MKKTIVTVLVLGALNGYAQPKDTLQVVITHWNKDGLLQRVNGYLVRTFTQGTNGKSYLDNSLPYNDKWVAIKPEDVNDIKQRQ